MQSASAIAYRRFLRWKPWLDTGFWLAATAANAFANSAAVMIEYQRRGQPLPTWEPLAWEWSSNLVVLALVPATAWFTRRWPVHWDTWRRRIPLYLAASVAWSAIHIAGMTLLRQAVYALHGARYQVADWPRELLYEYLKDARSFLLIVAIMLVYRGLLRSWQGEASLLAAPEEGPPVEPVERPGRFLVRKLGRDFLVAAADVEWLQAAGNYVNLRVRGHDYPLRSTISGIEARLDPGRFVRIHRSYIVNLDQVAAIEPMDDGDARVHLHDGTALPCSRRHRDALRARIAPPPAPGRAPGTAPA